METNYHCENTQHVKQCMEVFTNLFLSRFSIKEITIFIFLVNKYYSWWETRIMRCFLER